MHEVWDLKAEEVDPRRQKLNGCSSMIDAQVGSDGEGLVDEIEGLMGMMKDWERGP